MKAKLEQIKVAALDAIGAAQNAQDIDAVRVKYLGKKGELTAILKQMGGLSPEERPIMGQLVNSAKAELETVLEQKNAQMKAKATEEKLAAETIDITMPAKVSKVGKLHPLNTVLNDMIDIFQSMGFDVLDGPEVETDHYNFECLNVPADHPARDMQDTFYLGEVYFCAHRPLRRRFAQWKTESRLSALSAPDVCSALTRLTLPIHPFSTR